MSMRFSEPILLNRFVALKEAIFVSWKRRARTTSWEDTSMIIRFFFFITIDANLQPSYFKYREWCLSIRKEPALVQNETLT